MPSKRPPKSNRYVVPNGSANSTSPILQEIAVTSKPRKQARSNGSTAADTGLSWYDDFIAQSVNNPRYHMEHAYPWGKPESRYLEKEKGLDEWQVKCADLIANHLSQSDKILRVAVASGNNVGKTAFLAMMTLYFISTNPFCRILIASSSGTNLHTRTWTEVDKWLQMSPMNAMFEWKHSKLEHREYPTQWFALPQTWSHERPDGFSGLHERKVLIIFDEASAFPPVMWETAESCLTSTGSLWLAFGNPHHARGPFRDCFEAGVNADRWKTFHVDSRESKRPDREKLDADVAHFGIDSDYVRIHILGKFPRHGEQQLIAENFLDDACERQYGDLSSYPTIIGVDVATGVGGDSSVILVRKGPKILKTYVYKEYDEVVFAGYLEQVIREYHIKSYGFPHATDYQPDEEPYVFIDAIGYGHTVGLLLQERGYKRIELAKGSYSANDNNQHHNKRAEMYADVRNWVKDYACFDKSEDKELIGQLGQIRYLIDLQGRWQIEGKKEMKSRGFASPDQADALSLTFYARIQKRQLASQGPIEPFYHPARGLWGRS